LRIALVLLAFSGCAVSGILSSLSVPASKPATLLGARLCAPTARINCDYVLSSRWARVGPVPTANLGLAYFVMLAAWFLAVGLPNYGGRGWHLFPLILTACGVCVSVCFLYVMAALLPVWCTWCVAGHVVNILIFLLTVVAWPRTAPGRTDLPDEPPYPSHARAGAVLGGSAAMALMLLLAGLAYRNQMVARRFQLEYLKATNNVEYIAWRFGQSPLQEIPIRGDDVSFGDADAPFTLVVFSDFECNNCWDFHRNVYRIISQFPGTLRCVFKSFPVSARCNPYVGRGLHYVACDAAFAAEAARVTGSVKQTHQYRRLLYENRNRFDAAPYVELARRVGLDPQAFIAAIASDEVHRRVKDDIDLGHRLGV